MDLNYSAITDSPEYAKDKKQVDITGKKKSKLVWLLIFIPVLWIPLLGWALWNIPKARKEHRSRQALFSEFARQNSFTYQEVPLMQKVGESLLDVELTLPFKAKMQTNSGLMMGTLHTLPFDYLSSSVELVDYKGFSATSGPATRILTALYITLPIALPRLFIDTKRNNVFGFEATAK